MRAATQSASRCYHRLSQHANRHLLGSGSQTRDRHTGSGDGTPMKRLLPGAVGVVLLLALLTWLLLRGIETNAAAYAVTLQTFDQSGRSSLTANPLS